MLLSFPNPSSDMSCFAIKFLQYANERACNNSYIERNLTKSILNIHDGMTWMEKRIYNTYLISNTVLYIRFFYNFFFIIYFFGW